MKKARLTLASPYHDTHHSEGNTTSSLHGRSTTPLPLFHQPRRTKPSLIPLHVHAPSLTDNTPRLLSRLYLPLRIVPFYPSRSSVSPPSFSHVDPSFSHFILSFIVSCLSTYLIYTRAFSSLILLPSLALLSVVSLRLSLCSCLFLLLLLSSLALDLTLTPFYSSYHLTSFRLYSVCVLHYFAFACLFLVSRFIRLRSVAVFFHGAFSFLAAAFGEATGRKRRRC
ncbi:hypothetical protein BDY24DRAFT_377840 [Mrakia frigida]|uniref:uncharacterized protein n=1 Tax=Mrakia frigida TaxID=29902 RepID=UPI003FCC00A9